ncbi:MAG: OmpA family protein [Bacteroidota bacterium]
MKQFYFFLFFLFSSLLVFGQEDETHSKDEETPSKKEQKKEAGADGATYVVVGTLQRAEELINLKRYRSAIQELKAVIRKKPKMSVAHRVLGLVYWKLEQYEEALAAYQQGFQLNSKISRAAYFECGEVLFRMGKFEEAQQYYSYYNEMKGQRYTNESKEEEAERLYDKMYPVRLQNCQFAISYFNMPNTEDIENLGKTINSPEDEYFPSISADKKWLLYTSRKRAFPDETQSFDENIYLSAANNKSWERAKPLKGDINTPKNEGLAKFSFGSESIYFASCQRDDITRSCDIFVTEMEEYHVITIEEVEGKLNSDDWDSQPCISCDRKSLYFSSSRDGGYGGADIWVSHFENGEWGLPRNLGPLINTQGDEESPFLAADGKTLYFSSTGHPGFGDSDLFISRLANDSWGRPVNLGFPINSQFEEHGVYIPAGADDIYFASQRSGGFGGLDLYRASLNNGLAPDPMILLKGKVTTKINAIPIETPFQAVHYGKKYPAFSSASGVYHLCVPKASSYAFHVQKQGYEPYVEVVIPKAEHLEVPLVWEIQLEPTDDAGPIPTVDVYKLPKGMERQDLIFYFSSGSSELGVGAEEQIQRIATVLEGDPTLMVLIKGFADDIGDSSKNMLLSSRRSKAVEDLLINQGVESKRIQIMNLGEISKSKDLSDEERAANRRVELAIIR